jgi:cephalosporin hydroxylase
MRDEELKDLVNQYFELHGRGSQEQRRVMGLPMRPHEAMILYGLVVREKPDVIFESGTAVGWSATWMTLASDAPVYTFDPVARKQLFSPKDKEFYFTNAEFAEVKHLLPSWSNKKKLFLVDGDHRRRFVLRDFNAIVDFLAPGDIMVFHDTAHAGGPIRAISDIRGLHPGWRYEFLDTANGLGVVTCE